MCACFFFFNDPATTEIYTLSLHDALPICESSTSGLDVNDLLSVVRPRPHRPYVVVKYAQTLDDVWSMRDRKSTRLNSSHSQISYAVFCLKKKKKKKHNTTLTPHHTPSTPH